MINFSRNSLLLRNKAFLKLWIGQGITQIGSEITLLALPIYAITMLNITTFQMGTLVTLELLPPIFLGIFFGVFIDRYSPRKFLVVSDFLRMSLLVILVVLSYIHQIRYEVLCFIAVLMSSCRAAFDIAYPVFSPSIVDREEILEANSEIGKARSLAEVVGPPLGGLLIGAIQAVNALLIDAASFLVSAVCIWLIPPKNIAVPDIRQRAGIFNEMWEGARIIRKNRIQIIMLSVSAIWNFFYCMISTIFVMYAIKSLDVSPTLLGATFLPGGIGFFVGSSLSSHVSKRFGTRQTAIIGISITVGWGIMTALAGGGALRASMFLMCASFLFGLGQALYNISALTIRQLATPSEYLGRVSAISSVIYRSTLPLGAFLAGALGTHLSLHSIVTIGTIGLAFSALMLFLAPMQNSFTELEAAVRIG